MIEFTTNLHSLKLWQFLGSLICTVSDKMDSVFDLMTNLDFYKEALILLATGVILPSFDIYSDIALSYSLISGTYCDNSECPKHPNYGAIMFIPIIMANLFTIPHWLKRENTWKKRLLTLPLFLGQFWPQYQALKVFWLIKNKDLKWRKKKEELDREIGSIEPFLESLPQVNIIFSSHVNNQS